MEKIFVPHTELYVLWCCKVKSGPFILSSSKRGIFLPCINFSKTLQRIKQPMQRHFHFRIL